MPIHLLTITPEEMVEIPGITVPNIRAILCAQRKIILEQDAVKRQQFIHELLGADNGGTANGG